MEINQEAYLNRFRVKATNHHDFQFLGKEISDWVKQPAYFLFAKYHHQKIIDAFAILQKRGNHSLHYLVGIIKKLK